MALAGNPNVGKSTLVNTVIGERKSIVEDSRGVTRDRIYGEGEWRGVCFTVIDTGGIEPKSQDVILSQMRDQAQIAIDLSDVIIFMCDIRTGLLPDDKDIAMMLKRSGKPIVLCCNKADTVGDLPMTFYEFYELGFDRDPIALSSLHGSGSGDVLDAVISCFPEQEETEPDDTVIQVAVIGKPNAGKSSLINKMLGEKRMIVSDIAGTTRDAVDTRLENEYGVFNLIDTAGIRRSAKIEDRLEKFSVLRAKMAVERADVCLIMIDAAEGITEQDEKIAGIAHEAGKASVILVNKWDSIEKDTNTAKTFQNKIRAALSYMPYAPILFVSALTGQRLQTVFETICRVKAQAGLRITT
ncbi:MAG: ribosome biogenesis GTPase Der, partial [Clostridia bacterium]|nr:ribosome biogenesis GTPase Der [Clostridia bacterium]